MAMNRVGRKDYFHAFRERNLEYLYFTKNKEWESENEFRLIYFSDKKEDEFLSIKNSLKGIYLGLDFEENYLPSIAELANGVSIYRLEYGDMGRLRDIQVKL